MKALSNEKKQTLLTRTRQFKDSELESRFIGVKINQDKHIARLLLAVIALVLSILLCFDHMVIKQQYWPAIALVWRGGLVICCIAAIFMLRHLKNVASFRAVTFILTAFIFANLQGMVLIYKDDYFLHALFDIIIVIAIYFSTLFNVLMSIFYVLYIP